MLVYGKDRELCEWVGLGIFGEADAFSEMCKAIGVLRDGKIIAAVVYSDYQEDCYGRPLSIELSIHSVDKRWATRHNLEAFFSYPFTQLRLGRIQTLCSAQDEGVINFNKRLGFILEGRHRKAWPLGGDALSWSMLKNECKWIKHG